MNSSHSTATVKEIELREMTSGATSLTIWPRLVAKMVETEGDVVENIKQALSLPPF